MKPPLKFDILGYESSCVLLIKTPFHRYCEGAVVRGAVLDVPAFAGTHNGNVVSSGVHRFKKDLVVEPVASLSGNDQDVAALTAAGNKGEQQRGGPATGHL